MGATVKYLQHFAAFRARRFSTNETMTAILDFCQSKPREYGTGIRRWLLRAGSRQASRSDRGSVACGRRRGAITVETALVLNVCLIFLLGLFDFSRVIMIRQVVTNAAREGCRYAVVNTSTATTSQVQTYVTNYLCGQQIGSLVINVYQADPTTGNNLGAWTNAGLSNSVGVQITGTISTVTPTFSMLPSTVPVQATCIMASEGN
jgi:Flp pilus assembly protein TadG